MAVCIYEMNQLLKNGLFLSGVSLVVFNAMSLKEHREKLKSIPYVPISWRPKYFRYNGTEQSITSTAGVGPMVDLFFEDPLFQEFRRCLPPRVSPASYHSELFAMTTICSGICGHDSIDDVLEFHDDPGIREKLGGEIPAPKTMGDYYRSFQPQQVRDLNEFLRKQSRRYREQVTPNRPLIIDMDSTSHIQRGLKMEGVEWNYKRQWALDSLVAWDELGLCHGMELRRGRTFSSQGAPEMIRHVFGHLKHSQEKHFRADSAFHNKKVILTLVNVGAKFTITAHRNSNWEDKVNAGAITNWEPWVYSEAELEKAAEQKISLPKIEVGSMLYKPGWSPNVRFYVVVKRTWTYDKKKKQCYWKNYGVVNNWNLFRNKPQTIIEWHNQRGSSENLIKEEKYSFDLLHFPMQKLLANHAYGLLFLVAHNLMRTISLLDDRKAPMFAKKLRRKYVFIAGRLITQSGRKVMRMPQHKERMVQAMMTAWRATLQPLLAKAG